MKKYEVALFDLDGTLINTSKGIYNSVRFAEENMGFKPLAQDKLKNFIGPPPIKSYMENHKVSKELAIKATAYHRSYGAEHGVYEADVYEGIEYLLKNLKESDIKLGVCTLKRQDIAEKILENFKIKKYFDTIIGIDKQESMTKKDTINKALENMGVDNKKKAILIGDSVYDAEGAESAGVDFIGVLYGFGLNKDERYDFLTVDTVSALTKLLC